MFTERPKRNNGIQKAPMGRSYRVWENVNSFWEGSCPDSDTTWLARMGKSISKGFLRHKLAPDKVSETFNQVNPQNDPCFRVEKTVMILV